MHEKENGGPREKLCLQDTRHDVWCELNVDTVLLHSFLSGLQIDFPFVFHRAKYGGDGVLDSQRISSC